MKVAVAVLVIIASLPVRAEEELSAPGQAMLSFLGLAPLFTGAKSAFLLGVSPPRGDFTRTTLFRGVPGGPDSARSKTWALGPGFVSNGQWATVFTTVALQFGGSTPQASGDVSLERTFAVKILYHGGVNLLGLTGLGDARRGHVALGLGPAVAPVMGPKYTLRVPDGTLSYANIRVELAPSVSLSLLGDGVSLVAMAGYGPGSRLFVPISFGAGEGAGSLSSFKAGDGAATTIEDVKAALQTLQPKGTAFGVLMGTMGLPSGENAPFLTLGLRVEARRTEFVAAPGAQVWTPGFIDQELRAFVGLGISAPEGYDWSKP